MGKYLEGGQGSQRAVEPRSNISSSSNSSSSSSSIFATCFGHSYGHLQEGALQRTDKSKYYRSFWNQRIYILVYKILNFKNNTWFKIHIKD